MPPEAAPGHPHLVRVRAPNPGPMTLTGTNTYVVSDEGRAWVIDPGPRIDEHLDAIRAAAAELGEIAGVLLTHGHSDHSEAAEDLGAEVVLGNAAGYDEVAVFTGEEVSATGQGSWPDSVGPFVVVPTPGHAADHVCLAIGSIVICGDLVLGEGSSIVPPRSHGGSLAQYMASLDRAEALGADLLAPGHGPWITDPAAKIAEYRAHRLEREQKLVAALEAGKRGTDELLDAAWDDVPDPLRPAAAIALEAHMEKLREEGRLGE